MPASSVITLILLHLIFVLEIAAANYKVLRMWFTYPALRIQSFPVWSPIIEAQFVLFTLCVLGLSAAKPWSWWLAIFLDGSVSLLHFFYLRYLFLSPFSTDIGLALIEYLLVAIALLLLFFPSVLRHYSVDHFISRHPALQSAAARIQFPFVDKMMTRFIAAAQLTVVLLLFLRTLPYLGFIYFAPITIFGAVSASLSSTSWHPSSTCATTARLRPVPCRSSRSWTGDRKLHPAALRARVLPLRIGKPHPFYDFRVRSNYTLDKH